MTGDLVRELCEGVWSFRHRGGPVSSETLRFHADGTISGYDHPNERSWRCRDDVLELLSEAGQVSSRFPHQERYGATLLRLNGQYLLSPELELEFVLERKGVPAPRTLATGTRHQLKQEIDAHGWEIGEHTYGVPLVYAADAGTRLRIGRFCSIGHAVTIALVNHRTDFVTTYPFPSHRQVWPDAPRVSEYASRGDVEIGNDVWIGHGVFIGSGVKVGDGAVLGAHAVVTKDVPPYGVVVGNPSKLIRYRFDAASIADLLELRWWDWPDETLDRFLPHMLSDDVRSFIALARQNAPRVTNGAGTGAAAG